MVLFWPKNRNCCFKPVDHGSTLGNPLATAGFAVVNAILQDGLEQVTVGLYLQNQLEKLQTKYSFIKEVRGLG